MSAQLKRKTSDLRTLKASSDSLFWDNLYYKSFVTFIIFPIPMVFSSLINWPEFIQDYLVGIFIAITSFIFGLIFTMVWNRKKVRKAPKVYVERIGNLIEHAYREGPSRCVINARAIVATRNTLRNSLQNLSGLMNSEIDNLADMVGSSYDIIASSRIGTGEEGIENFSPNRDLVWESIEVLYRYWPAKSEQIEFEMRKVLVDMGLL